jgi:superfamily II DNA helicase RecQ
LPQGSILSPLLFILFINDVTSLLLNSTVFLFADDLVIYKCIESNSDAVKLQDDLNKIVFWALIKKMAFNVSKCSVLHLFPKINNKFDYKINDTILVKNVVQRDLGVLIDENLNFDLHRSQIQNTCFRMLGVINKSFRYHNVKFLLTMFKTFVLPHLAYCSTIWNPTKIKDILELERIQRRATSRMTNDYSLRYEDRLKLFSLQPLYVSRAHRDIKTTGKLLNKTLHCSDNLMSTLESLKIKNTNLRFSTRNKNDNHFVKGKFQNKLHDSFLLNRVTNQWNSLKSNRNLKEQICYNSIEFEKLKKYFC